MRGPDTVGENFFIFPDTREEALAFAFESFPELLDRFVGGGSDLRADVYYVYGVLADVIVLRWEDRLFRSRACEFIDRLAESGDSLFEELLVVCVLERLGENEAMAAEARRVLGLKASALLKSVEHDLFGRFLE